MAGAAGSSPSPPSSPAGRGTKLDIPPSNPLNHAYATAKAGDHEAALKEIQDYLAERTTEKVSADAIEATAKARSSSSCPSRGRR